ncbi:MAG TPA: hypothetical protein VFB96_15255 [Pirellulaceae bacterium]|nr:hypothetical protein [Pirellulaceae bacterium]
MRTTLAMILVFATAAAAQAGWCNRLGRHCGLGWSDGYHARSQGFEGCGQSCAIPPGGYMPQGPILVPEPQPTPARPPREELPVPRTTASRTPASGGTVQW